MGARGSSWMENFFRETTTKCKNESCMTLVTTTVATLAANGAVYCAECRAEAKRITDRNYYERKGRALREQRRQNAVARKTIGVP